MSTHPLKSTVTGVLGLVLLALFMLFPAQSAKGALDGLIQCGKRVIPALFPFFVISNLLLASPLIRWLGFFLRPFTRFCLGIRAKEASSVLFISWLGGFAVAADSVSQLYRQGRITAGQAQVLLVCGVGSSPAFVVNTVGLLMLGNLRLGGCIYAALLLANLCCGVLAGVCFARRREVFAKFSPAPSDSEENGLVPAVANAIHAILTVCGFVVFFSCLCSCLTSLLPELPALRFITSSFFEVTGGCLAAAQLEGTYAVFSCCCALSVLSLSVLLQVRALLHKDISLLAVLFSRPFHLVFSLFFLKLLLRLIPGCAETAASFTRQVIAQSRLAPDAAFVLFLLCCLVLRFTSGGEWDIIMPRKKPKSSGNVNEVL